MLSILKKKKNAFIVSQVRALVYCWSLSQLMGPDLVRITDILKIIQPLNEFKSSSKNGWMPFKIKLEIYNSIIGLRIWYPFLSPSKKQMSGAGSVFIKSSITSKWVGLDSFLPKGIDAAEDKIFHY